MTALSASLLTGDHARFQAVFRAELGYVLASLRRLGVPAADVEDLAHDVFVVVFRHWDTYDPARPLRPWLFGIAFRVASDFRRLARHRFERGSDDPASQASAGAHRPGEAIEARSLVQLGLEALDIDQRAVLVLHDVEGHAMPEVALALGIPLNTAYSRLRLGRIRFRRAVQASKGGGR